MPVKSSDLHVSGTPLPEKIPVKFFKLENGNLVEIAAGGEPSPSSMLHLRMRGDEHPAVHRIKSVYGCVLDVLHEMTSTQKNNPNLEQAINRLIESSMWAVRGATGGA